MITHASSKLRTSPHSQKRADYVKSLIKHPAHLFAMAWLPLFAVVTGWVDAAFVLFAAGEIILLTVVSADPRYRRAVDARQFAKECSLASLERARVLARMTTTHSQELQLLEKVADRVRDRLTPGDMTGETDCLGIDDLLAMYARSAVAYAQGRATLGEGSLISEAITTDARSIADSLTATRTPEARALATRRLEVSQLRADRWRKSFEDLEIMSAQLALIADIVRLTCEHAGAPVLSCSRSDDLERALSSVGEVERTIGELTELLADDDTSFDPRTLRKGRIHSARVAVATSGIRVSTENRASDEGVNALATQRPDEIDTEQHYLMAPPLKLACCAYKA